mmetsp:Transcript_25491/g.37615  ORF Transcript_25491/g.37615 Transcript_25491/m.37615 type:complete len:360 (+) Transcript_25491:118-1197(+)|eukprot:CAMPEP_0185030850 /NCGR_PEP_ID=MMETSP1103-20130426/17949_1 /TAXON_ID=36769 /ORGANISM="Paraphysomonas bandaiensis, Strain Caron Lab Isolate" /LENGTH=359 /DNA_ID=CAMNT_0027566131 /DNA_START=94 /DNA_END=1173 /DNA_ORIENTATION=-
MSTKMSTDLNIERSSTRRHAPPGGNSSICFGDSAEDVPKAPVGKKHQTSSGSSSIKFGDSEPPEQRVHTAKKMHGGGTTSIHLGDAPQTGTEQVHTAKKHVAGGASSISFGDSGAIEKQFCGKKHVEGHGGKSSVALSDNAPVDPPPLGRKHVPATNTTSSIFRLDTEPEASPSPIHTAKKYGNGGGSTISLGESEPVLERPNTGRKHVPGSNSATSISFGDSEPPPDPANIHTAKKQSSVIKSSISLSDDAPVEKVHVAKKQHARGGASSLTFGAGEPERPTTGRRHAAPTQAAMSDVFNHDSAPSPVENKPANQRAQISSNSSQMSATLTRSDAPAQEAPSPGRRKTAGGASSIVLG